MIQTNRRLFCAAIAATAAFSALPAAAQTAAKSATKSAAKTATKTAAAAAASKSGYPSIVGSMQTHVTVYEDSLVDLARKFGLGYTEIVSANPGVDPWVPGADKKIVLPTAHILPAAPYKGIVINLADQRLYFFREDGKSVDSMPLGIGNIGWDTPKGTTKVVRKKKNPTWYVPKSVRKEDPELPAIVKPGPDNPLGSHAVYLGWPAYLFHGTNKPYGVGRRVSHGCVRLYPEDIARLFGDIKVGMPVTVVDQPMKVTMMDGQLWLEIHPSQLQADEVEQTGKHTPSKPAEFEFLLTSAAGDNTNRIDWEKAKRAALERRGIPIPILRENGLKEKDQASVK
ncbi:MAG: L,D-transpeptidase family protein [Alphaproteobacteria bacterium]|nr:L,D-transpeptidase family protein [Alphaproteobacteria bacterium]